MIHTLRNIGIFFLLVLLVSGCSTPLKNSWRNFNAYFNTYYNAKTSFERGLELQEQQEVRINPERPVRIHNPPHRAGQSDFEKAMQKGADIIRFHAQSKWVDYAIEMIGMSYFYQQQYFSADQKFVELLNTTSDPDLRQRAILWRGRAALELENYLEGINYLQSRLFSTEFEWDDALASEIKLVIAQLYVEREEYEDAVVYLAEALPRINDRKLEMRGHFLHGQLLEILGRYEEAFDAYEKAAHRRNPSYDMIYHAERKLGVVARKKGDVNWARQHFASMSRDDRHYEYIAAIEYEIARTTHRNSEYDRARSQYEQVLRRRTQQPAREVQAKIYYGIAEIYRDHRHNYSLAAAYFDSSAQRASDPDLLPLNFDADLMSRSYGEYSRMQKEINRLDSLLWLAGLSETELDSVIAVIREEKIEELRQQEREQRRTQLVSLGDMDELPATTDDDGDSGFLNHKNPQLLQQYRQAFQAYWGGRPLVDDWRQMEAVRINMVRQFEEEGKDVEDVDQALKETVAPSEQIVEIDISEIPFSDEEKKKTNETAASFEYETGNVFFLSLSMPDSAAYYYQKALNRSPGSELASQALYSLSELYYSQGDTARALDYALKLTESHGNTLFAERIADRLMIEFEKPEIQLSREDSIAVDFQSILSLPSSPDRARRFREFVNVWPDAETAPKALFFSALDYIKTAREEENYVFQTYIYNLHEKIRKQHQQEFQVLQDSVRALMADSLYLADIKRIEEAKDNDNNNITNDPDTLSQKSDTLSSEIPGNDFVEKPEDEDMGAESFEAADEEPEPLPQKHHGDLLREADEAEPDVIQADTLSAEMPGEKDVSTVEDTIHTEQPKKSIREHLLEITEKELPEHDFSDLFPYEGALWDSARVSLLFLQDDYPNFEKNTLVNLLSDEIKADRARAFFVDTELLYERQEVQEQPEIEGGWEDFLVDSGLQNTIDKYRIRGSITLGVHIHKEGYADSLYIDENRVQLEIDPVIEEPEDPAAIDEEADSVPEGETEEYLYESEPAADISHPEGEEPEDPAAIDEEADSVPEGETEEYLYESEPAADISHPEGEEPEVPAAIDEEADSVPEGEIEEYLYESEPAADISQPEGEEPEVPDVIDEEADSVPEGEIEEYLYESEPAADISQPEGEEPEVPAAEKEEADSGLISEFLEILLETVEQKMRFKPGEIYGVEVSSEAEFLLEIHYTVED